MPKKNKIPKNLLAKIQGRTQRRLTDYKLKNRFFLIVCEGTKTEPNYFISFKDDLPNGVLDTEFIIIGTGQNTQSIVRTTKNLLNKYNKKYDEVWVVFDRDSFPASQFDNAINSCAANNPKIECAWSNEAFELWYLLHFHLYETPLKRTEFKNLIETNLNKKIPKFKYKKNSEEMYSILKKHGNINKAIKWAKRLHDNYRGTTNYSKHNPCTTVYLLVEKLLEYKKNS